MPKILKDEMLPFRTLTPEHLKASMNWFESMCSESKWNLNSSEKLKLLGDITNAQYVEMFLIISEGEITEPIRNAIERLSLLITISDCLAEFSGTGSAIALFSKPNSNAIFGSTSIKDFLLKSESIDNFYKVEKYLLDAIYG